MSPAALTRVVAVAPVHNRRELTLQCVASLLAGDLTGIDLRIVIVDDGSTDGTTEALATKYPQVQVVPGDGTLYYTAGTNRGLTAALAHDPHFILAMNDDQRFRPDTLQAMVQCAQAHPRTVVGALLVSWDDPQAVFQVDPQWSIGFGGWHHWRHLRVADVPDRPWVVRLIVGNCVLYPAAAVREVGLMNERQMPMYGDAEYTPRMSRRGWQLLIEPAAVVECQPNGASPDVRHMNMAGKYQQLWGNRRSPYNLRSIAAGLWGGAPSHAAGVLAFVVHLARLAAKAVGLAGRWPQYEPDRSRWHCACPR